MSRRLFWVSERIRVDTRNGYSVAGRPAARGYRVEFFSWKPVYMSQLTGIFHEAVERR